MLRGPVMGRCSVFGSTLSLLLALAPAPASAEGSGGAGGRTGTRTEWPCAGCITVTPPGYDPATPTPLLLTFHGDEGDPSYIHSHFEDPAPAAGFLLVSLECPRSLGCGGSWWRWESSRSHDDFAWVFEQVAAVEAEYNVERDQIYAAGFSGGSSYLSELVPRFSDRIAGAVYLGGGYRPWGADCPACPIPIHFVIGSRDFLLDGATDLREFYAECGHEVDWQLVSGVDHRIVGDRLPGVLEAMVSRRHPCRSPAPEPETPDAGAPPGDAGSGAVDAGAPVPTVDGGGGASPSPDPDPSAPRELAIVGDCAAAPARSPAPAGLGWLLLYWVARRTRARAKRSSAARC